MSCLFFALLGVVRIVCSACASSLTGFVLCFVLPLCQELFRRAVLSDGLMDLDAQTSASVCCCWCGWIAWCCVLRMFRGSLVLGCVSVLTITTCPGEKTSSANDHRRPPRFGVFEGSWPSGGRFVAPPADVPFEIDPRSPWQGTDRGATSPTSRRSHAGGQ